MANVFYNENRSCILEGKWLMYFTTKIVFVFSKENDYVLLMIIVLVFWKENYYVFLRINILVF